MTTLADLEAAWLKAKREGGRYYIEAHPAGHVSLALSQRLLAFVRAWDMEHDMFCPDPENTAECEAYREVLKARAALDEDV